MDVSIIILNYKQKGLVKQCVKGILSSQPKLDYEIIVVDNNSGDGCLEEIENYLAQTETQISAQQTLSSHMSVLPKYQTIQAGRNGGFAKGHNVGIAKASGKYIITLNPDIAIVPGVLEAMFEYMEKNPGVGLVGPKLINPDGSIQFSCRRFPSWKMPLYRRSFLGKLPGAKKSLSHYLMQDFNHLTTVQVDWLFGACLMIRKSVSDKIGFFDERFFLYFEDLDLCRRIWQAGTAVVYLADVEMVHYHQRLSAEKSGIFGIFKKAGRIHLVSGLKYFAKYLGVPLPREKNSSAGQRG